MSKGRAWLSSALVQAKFKPNPGLLLRVLPRCCIPPVSYHQGSQHLPKKNEGGSQCQEGKKKKVVCVRGLEEGKREHSPLKNGEQDQLELLVGVVL